LAELYGAEVSSDLISRVTDAVLDEVRQWQNRPLDPVYPVVFFDAWQPSPRQLLTTEQRIVGANTLLSGANGYHGE
jgi:hypothetical protein